MRQVNLAWRSGDFHPLDLEDEKGLLLILQCHKAFLLVREGSGEMEGFLTFPALSQRRRLFPSILPWPPALSWASDGGMESFCTSLVVHGLLKSAFAMLLRMSGPWSGN